MDLPPPTGWVVLRRHPRDGSVKHCITCDDDVVAIVTVKLTTVACVPLSSDDRCTSGADWRPLVCCYTLSRSSTGRHTRKQTLSLRTTNWSPRGWIQNRSCVCIYLNTNTMNLYSPGPSPLCRFSSGLTHIQRLLFQVEIWQFREIQLCHTTEQSTHTHTHTHSTLTHICLQYEYSIFASDDHDHK